ncbi:hypothetical protein Goshw_029227 [Gossypium schwendimanii]|uniref:Leucine-rich repeat-containing N-terminal plant-type domain-containing protein n=1 Tax=Gossypium schwendimanii TaxID=34291 RepID=A0A7J9L6L0_GOSSC|nr:hypothetical protein [Gossypium schwendimanii]
MTNLTFLEVLNLAENNLVGPIPHGNQFDTFDNDSYSNNLGLCGLPLSKQCINHEGDKPPSPLVVEHDGYILFTTERPWWFLKKVERDWQYNFTRWVQRNRARRN